MKSLFKNPLLYTNILLLALVSVLAPQAAPNYAKAYGFVRSAFAAVVGPINGAGTLNFIASFAGATPSYEIGDSIIYDDGASPRKIGIDTTSPGAKLDINATADPLLRLRQGANPATTFRVGTDGVMVIDNDGVSGVIALNAGNVGIRALNPSEALHVNGKLRVGDTIIWDNEINRAAASTNKNLHIGYRDTTLTTIQANGGNVGIGTTDPGAYALAVKRADVGGYTQVRINNTDTANSASHARLTIDTSTGGGDALLTFSTGGGDIGMGIDNTDDKFKIAATSDLSANVRLTIDSSGRVGIGTINPQAELHVQGTMILAPQASDPASPVNGQIWLRE